MPHITTCSVCGRCYEETSEEQANHPVRECKACRVARQNGGRFEHNGVVNQAQFTPDDLGFIQTASNRLLAAVARQEVDLNRLALVELASRGLDCDGAWVGFDRAREIHGFGR